MYGGGETRVGRMLRFSFLFPPPTGFAIKGNQAVGDAMPLFLECLQPHQVIYNPWGCARINNPMVYRHLRHPRGVGSWIHYSFVIFFPLIEQSLVMDPKQLIKSVSALCLSQQVPSYNSKRAVETKQNKTKQKTKNKT